ncbi:hypothetical protein AHAS_Ahas06G0230000 [Arachis hypogaea]
MSQSEKIPPSRRRFTLRHRHSSPQGYTQTALLVALIVLLIVINFQGDIVDYGGGWQGGHATFYGGGDASGTMDFKKKRPLSN